MAALPHRREKNGRLAEGAGRPLGYSFNWDSQTGG